MRDVRREALAQLADGEWHNECDILWLSMSRKLAAEGFIERIPGVSEWGRPKVKARIRLAEAGRRALGLIPEPAGPDPSP